MSTAVGRTSQVAARRGCGRIPFTTYKNPVRHVPVPVVYLRATLPFLVGVVEQGTKKPRKLHVFDFENNRLLLQNDDGMMTYHTYMLELYTPYLIPGMVHIGERPTAIFSFQARAS